MATKKISWGDQQIEVIIGNLLRLGVIIAAAVTLLGGVLFLAHHGGEHVSYEMFRSEPAFLRTVGGVIAGAFTFRGTGIIQLGILLLILTPIARVVFSIAGFAKEKDILYVFVTLTVLTLLLFSLSGGKL
jgi:uncharacterized membrane protein